MAASRYEQDLAASHGVHLVFNARPAEIRGDNAAEAIVFEYTRQEGSNLVPTGETLEIATDQVFVAIGQWMDAETEDLELDGTTLARFDGNKSSVSNVWVGGDCAHGGEDLTVTAVEDGKIAAESIHRALSA